LDLSSVEHLATLDQRKSIALGNLVLQPNYKKAYLKLRFSLMPELGNA